MKPVSLTIFAILFCFSAAAHAADSKAELKNIPLEWKPTEQASSFDAIDLTAFVKTEFVIKPFNDIRKKPQEIGKNVERRGTDQDLLVTTKDNVASWLTDRFAQVLTEFGIGVVKNNGSFILEADIVKFYVTEESTYTGDVGLKVRLRSAKNDNVLWEGMVSTSSSRWGRSYKAENYFESLSDATMSAVYALLMDDTFKEAVLKNK